MADMDYVAIAKELYKNIVGAANDENSGAKPSAPKETTGAAGSSVNEFLNRIGLLASNAGTAATGLYNLKDASKAFENSLAGFNTLASKFGIAGKTIGTALEYLNYYRDIAVQGAKVGIGQGQGARMQEESQKGGYANALEELEAIKKAGNAVRTFGYSAEDGNRKFLAFAQQVQSQPLVEKLKNLALIPAKEFADISMLAAGGKTDMLKSAEGQKLLAERTAMLSNEINRTAVATGKSRQEIIDEMQARKSSAIGIIENRAYLNDNERDQALKVQTATAGMGKTMQDITSTIMAGGYLDKTKRTELQVATGGRAGQYMSAVRDQRRTAKLADDDPQKVAAQKRLDSEIARANAYQSSQQFARRAMTTQDPAQRAAAEKFAVENVEADRQRQIQRSTGKGPTAAREEMRMYGDAMIQGRTQEGMKKPLGAPGTINEEAAPTQLMQGAVEAFRKNTASFSGGVRQANDELAKSPKLLDNFRTALEKVTAPIGSTQAQSDKNAQNAQDSIRRVFNADRQGTPEAQRSGKAAGQINAAGGGPTRDHGTLGETGSPTEPKDIVAKLHKGETVATPEQLRNLMSGSASNAISELMKSATTKTSPGTASAGGNIDISKITSGLKEITTTISSVSGGGSTTRKTVENDDAKTAKKELEAIKAQFQTEKNDLRTQVKGNLGADAKPVDIMRAMRDNPQAKALEARMQEATSKLSERISAGTTTKTVTESGAKPVSIADIQKNIAQGMSQFEAQKNAEARVNERTNINNKEEAGINRASINDMMDNSLSGSLSDKLTSVKGDTEIAQTEEVAQPKEEIQLEEPSDKIGLKDLNEQLVQLNTSIRQLIEHSAESVETAGKQVRATKGLSGNRFA